MNFPSASIRCLFSFSWRDCLVSTGIFFCAVEFCILLRLADSSDGFASPIFVLAVLLISRLTNGYLFGLIASVLGVIGVNYIFTYPYMAFNFTLSGYPLTFLTFLMVSIITSTLTTQIKQQERLRAENEKEKMRANLLRSVSHDIRTPLTSIIGATSAILENPKLSPTEQQELLEDIRNEAQWLIRVVENLLSITRIGDAGTQITKEPELAEEVLGESVRKFRKRFPAVAISVEAPSVPLFVPMDPILIEQVLSNLLENAVVHGKTTSQIRLSVQEKEHTACFSVSDNGQGIPKKEFHTLFDGTLKHSETSSGDGKRNMGLGLSVCLAIVRAHGGTMNAKNLSEGAEFSFRLPLPKKEELSI
ncbi:two-component system, OmpR family, sensor histidine kinase KdpD [Oscillibacter sp. PC13]|uniref:sensor histidine kinase n=1 Tax=Oscillibacter sp. PC13 TaxID=1855299 RepID=UPI0008E2EFE2|nr:DUF4118 domain-containing protein [Oscillibacter sp. PC13]SFP18957.1 two-component system, OmpR family, sensor histidine kinase KdpD [Oscillibacter sp. PC13]